MYKLMLKRMPSMEHGMFGVWCNDKGYPFMPSLERPWKDNTPYISCIPAGIYLCKRVLTNMESVHRAGYEETFEVQGVPGRTLIRVHPANWSYQLEGCIAPGSAYGYINDTPAIESSQDAFKEWMRMLDGIDEFELEIINMEPERGITILRPEAQMGIAEAVARLLRALARRFGGIDTSTTGQILQGGHR